jgi:aminoglycoside phosphotransferase (APT) family kinase protein
VPFLPGRPAASTPPADPDQAAAALGGFLGTLHAPAPAEAPSNAVRGIPLAERDPSMLTNLERAGHRIDQDAVRREWRAALDAAAWEGPPLWLHGDLHPLNILVHDGALSGVLDFGDITSGDPACDLAAAWLALGARGLGTFGREYETASGRAVSGDTWARARGWALALGVVFVVYSADNPTMAQIGREALDALLGPGGG